MSDRLKEPQGIGIQAFSPDLEGLRAALLRYGRHDAGAVEALRHLFFIMERLDKQAGPPFANDHFVKVTTETWLDLVRPAIQQVRAALASPEPDEEARP